MTAATRVVSVKWLSENLSSPNVRVVDATAYNAFIKRNAEEEYSAKHIPGAVFFDQNNCCDLMTPYVHKTLPTAKQFEDYVGTLGINNDTHVIVYDRDEKYGIYSAPRVWWMFKVFGYTNVSILDGGLQKWCEDKQEVTSQPTNVKEEKFVATFNSSLIKYFLEIESNISEKTFQLVDTRPSGRFFGKEPEHSSSIKSGHIPGSINIPFYTIMNPESKTIKDKNDLKQLFTEAGVKLDEPLCLTCGSGVTACCVLLAAEICEAKDLSLFNGSWSEWYVRSKPEQREDCPESEQTSEYVDVVYQLLFAAAIHFALCYVKSV